MLGWIIFAILVVTVLVIDLGFLNRKAHEVKIREALIWSGVWISLALLFNIGIYFFKGPDTALRFLTGYLIEESLSVDNLFVFLVIFSYFKVPAKYQHGVLFWGIVGAVVFRALFIAGGIALIHKFHWILYVFGGFLIFTGIKLAFKSEEEVHPEANPVLKIFKRWFPVLNEYVEGKYFVRKSGILYATPLFVVLLVIETTDVMFAMDSIPAILAITHDPFIVYTSNVFAILGLRSLYFALAGLMNLFHYLHYGLAVILVFVGAKMMISEFYKIPILLALGVIAGVLALSILASLLWPRKKAH